MTITGNQISSMEQRYRTTLVNSVSGFKSLQMVGTISTDGITNLALFNSIFHVGANPPLLGMVVRPDGAEHDTLKNIIATGQYTLNNVLPAWYAKAHQTSARFPSGESEFGECGFTKSYIAGLKAPFVKESTIKIGLVLRDIIDVSINNTSIVIGEIIYIILDENVIAADGYVDLEKAGSVTVAGLDSYHTTQRLGRLNYAKPGKHPEALSV
ncbi:flavin reductase [uncultured Mucilaginibacter sp.]|uniref:flavin reductase family protein n=1 Tax=uncultured Mucilaginibacter sp. TaxID=797541 RepID=UPI0025EB6EF6|nr:flavin reductase [uncultured Mucilaginibacter sp.]